MTLLEAVAVRRSRRKYLNTPLDEKTVDLLQKQLEDINHQTGLSVRFVMNDGSAFDGLTKSYGMFSGVRHYFGLIEHNGTENCQEKLGYYGESLVLLATTPGLGTCWVAGTFDRKACPFTLSDRESIACVITVGPVPSESGMREKLIYNLTHRKSKSTSEMYTSDKPVPSWFTAGMESVAKAPSAVNRQPVMFTYANGMVSASVKDTLTPGIAFDLGIAKYHFMLGVGGGEWQWGSGATFKRSELT